MNALEQRIRQAILADGPMPVSLYMLMCLHDPRDGYYATRPAFNRDFTTAPETSQVFGELIGAWAAHEWAKMGSPSPFWLIELGPGRGDLMADALRPTRGVEGFHHAMRLALVEASPMLRKVQAEKLAAYNPAFFDGLEGVPPGPAIILGNEFLDCLPVRQFVKADGQWRERVIGLRDDRLAWGVGLAMEPGEETNGDSIEIAPAIETAVQLLRQRFAAHGGRALFIDYGEDVAPGDTLRAYRSGSQVDPLADPGECDLTADVDFGRLKRIALRAGLSVFGPVPQGDFLSRLGVHERGRALAAANASRAAETLAAIDKLVAPDQMGARFKAICLAPADTPTPPGF